MFSRDKFAGENRSAYRLAQPGNKLYQTPLQNNAKFAAAAAKTLTACIVALNRRGENGRGNLKPAARRP
jgi:hypothetical protein